VRFFVSLGSSKAREKRAADEMSHHNNLCIVIRKFAACLLLFVQVDNKKKEVKNDVKPAV
jgi:hypothetical protein